uniref:MFS domain-containing protein n=1 Tax=Echinostoma caproni TaxID=27848 RepID=A0A183B5L7_9TREM
LFSGTRIYTGRRISVPQARCNFSFLCTRFALDHRTSSCGTSKHNWRLYDSLSRLDDVINYDYPPCFLSLVFQTIVLLGSSIFLLLLTILEDYYASLACMAMALACLGFHCSGILLNPQDLAPNHGGQLYGVMATVGTIPGFFGVYLAGYLLDLTHQWSVVFVLTSVLSLIGWVAYTCYGSAEQIL